MLDSSSFWLYVGSTSAEHPTPSTVTTKDIAVGVWLIAGVVWAVVILITVAVLLTQ